MMKCFRALALAGACTLTAACGGSDNANLPAGTGGEGAYTGIPDDAEISLIGTEPFWGGTVEGDTFTYTTPENTEGTTIGVARFAGLGGLSFSGEMDGQAVDLVVTPTECSDEMSDRTYPFYATLQIGAEQRYGCAWLEGAEMGAP